MFKPKQYGIVSAISDLATGGAVVLGVGLIIDDHRALTINQTTVGQALTLPTPFDPTIIFSVQVTNVGSAAYSMYGVTMTPSSSATFYWSGTAWTVDVAPTGSAGTTVVTVIPTAVNTVPSVAAPKPGTSAQFFVNEGFVAAGIAMSALGAITVTPATLGYNVGVTDSITVVYYV